MKTLLLLRHAKAAEAKHDMADHDRPLTDRGERDAARVGRLLREQDLAPDYVLASSSLRTLATAVLVSRACPYRVPTELRPDLYLAEPSAYLNALRGLGAAPQAAGAARVLIIGHNPGIEALLSLLTGENHTMPTASLACLTLSRGSFEEISDDDRWRLQDFWDPRELRD